MATFKRAASWWRWKGTREDFVEVARLMDGLVRVQDARDPRFDVAVGLSGLEETYETLDEFVEQINADDLQHAHTIVMTSRVRRPGPYIRVTFSWDAPAVRASVRGTDRTQVEGIAVRLYEQLDRGWRKLRRGHAAAFGIALQLLFVALVVVGFTVDAAGDFIADRPIGLALLIMFAPFLVLGAIGAVVLWLIPVLEIVPLDGRTRWERRRRAVAAAAGTLLIATTAGILVNLLT